MIRPIFFRPPRKGIRSDIQAIRAIAVAGVFIYHLWPARLTGGFLGVDIFFVVSGFLMTSHIVKGLEAGGWKKGQRSAFLLNFYFKRVRRLAPAALVALASVVAIYWLLFKEKVYLLSSTAEQVVSSALFVQNWKLASDVVDYLGRNNDATAVEHFWSLSVEEQFYAFWPVLLMLTIIVGLRLKKPSVTAAAIVGITLLSLVYGIYLTSTEPAYAYFVTPTRLWELSLGGVIAMLPACHRFGRHLGLLNNSVVSFAGVAICMASLLVLDGKRMSFPGAWALIPTVGTGLVIWAGRDQDPLSPTLFARLCNFRPAQFLGDISYSFYLWHFIVIKTYYFYELYFAIPFLPVQRILLMILPSSVDLSFPGLKKLLIILPCTLVLSSLSYYFVERTFLRVRRKFALIAGAILATAILIAFAAAIRDHADRNGALVRRATMSKIDLAVNAEFENGPFTKDLCIGAIALGHPETCGDAFGVIDPNLLDDLERDRDLAVIKHCDAFEGRSAATFCYLGDTASSKSVLLWGDSHAMHFTDALDVAAKRLGYKLVVAVRVSCPPLEFLADDPSVIQKGDAYWRIRHAPGCLERNNYVLNSDAFRDADLVLLASAYFSQDPPSYEAFGNNYKLLGQKKVAIIQDSPQLRKAGDNFPTDENARLAARLKRGELWADKSEFSINEEFFAHLDKMGLKPIVILTSENFCRGGKCYLAVGGLPVYADDGHMTGSYSRTMGPWFAKKIQEALDNPK